MGRLLLQRECDVYNLTSSRINYPVCITGNFYSKGDTVFTNSDDPLIIEGSCYVEGTLNVEKIYVKGDLYAESLFAKLCTVEGELHVDNILGIIDTLKVAENVSGSIIISENIICSSNINSSIIDAENVTCKNVKSTCININSINYLE